MTVTVPCATPARRAVSGSRGGFPAVLPALRIEKSGRKWEGGRRAPARTARPGDEDAVWVASFAQAQARLAERLRRGSGVVGRA